MKLFKKTISALNFVMEQNQQISDFKLDSHQPLYMSCSRTESVTNAVMVDTHSTAWAQNGISRFGPTTLIWHCCYNDIAAIR